MLEHQVAGGENIEEAMVSPPTGGRAQVRGTCIRRLAGRNGRYTCDWQGVWDCQGKRVLDLSDPFETEERWQEVPAEGIPGGPSVPVPFRTLLETVRDGVTRSLRTVRLRCR